MYARQKKRKKKKKSCSYTTQTFLHLQLQSTYNRTQRKWTCSAVLRPHREKGHSMTGFEGKGRKDTGEDGIGVRVNTR